MNTFLRGFLSLTSVGLLRSVLMLLVQWVAINFSSKEEYGQYVFAFTFFSIVSNLSQNITSDYAFKVISKKTSNTDAINIVRFDRSVSLLGIIFYGLVCTALVSLDLSRLDLSFIFILGLVIFHPLSYLKNELISQDKIQKLAEFELINVTTSFITNVVLAYFLGVVGLAIGQVCTLWFRQYMSWSYCSLFKYSHSIIFPNLVILKKYRPMAIRNGLQNVYQNADLIAMNFIFGLSMIADYKLAKSLASIPSKLLNPLWSSLRGKIFSPYVTGHKKKAMGYIFRGVFMVFLTYTALLILNYFFGTEVITKIYGDEFIRTQSYIYWVLVLFFIRDSSLSWFTLLLSINSWDNLMNWCYSIIIIFISFAVVLNVNEVQFFGTLLLSSIILLAVSFSRTCIR